MDLTSIIKNLIDDGFKFIGLSDGGDTVSEKTAFGIFVKPNPPVNYVVNVIDSQKISPAIFEAHSEKFLTKIRANKDKMNCTYTVDVNIIVGINDEIVSFINDKDFDITSQNHSIWWAVDEEKIINGKNMPDEIIGLKKLLQKSLGGKTEMTISEMEKSAFKKAESLKMTKKHTVTFCLLAVTIIAFLFIQFFGGDYFWATVLGNDRTRIVLYGEYYRLISCIFVHAGILHITYNCLSMYIFGTRSEEYLGHIGAFLLYFGAGLCGSLLSFFFTDGLSVGASGAIYGFEGAVFALSFLLKKSIGGLNYMTMLLFVIAGLGIGAMGGNVDNFAHIGGFLFGIIFSLIYFKFFGNNNDKEA